MIIVTERYIHTSVMYVYIAIIIAFDDAQYLAHKVLSLFVCVLLFRMNQEEATPRA